MIEKINRKIRIILLSLLSRMPFWVKKHNCNICGNEICDFVEGGSNSAFFLNRHVIGGGTRDKYLCPVCGALDRTRWCYYVLRKNTRIFTEPCLVLHFAPEKPLVNLIKKNKCCEYYTADINPKVAEYQVDITDIQFENSMFDYILVNHVLEHISDEHKAIQELKRVLKADGKMIVSFPICTDMEETFEDDSVKTPGERLEKFGQEDHVRLYGLDAKERLERYGLSVKQLSPKDILSVDEIERLGLIPDDIMFVCEKQH